MLALLSLLFLVYIYIFPRSKWPAFFWCDNWLSKICTKQLLLVLFEMRAVHNVHDSRRQPLSFVIFDFLLKIRKRFFFCGALSSVKKSWVSYIICMTSVLSIATGEEIVLLRL